MNAAKTKESKNRRAAGILMPVASLPSKDGVGSFGREAREFVDLLAEMGMKIWQILPLNPLGFGNSPYQPFSSYAGDEMYIDLEQLEEESYLAKGRKPYEAEGDPGRINYGQVKAYKGKYLREAYENFYKKSRDTADYESFQEKDWVYPYAVFMALKKQNGFICWNEWPKEQQDWILNHAYDISHLQEEIQYQMFLQYMFYKQWKALKKYANSKNVKIMGDIPIYVGIDSLDVWSCRENFLLDAEGKPSFVAGVPPDYFSPTGQRWGNPIYDWDHLKKEGFAFWVNRLRYNNELYDILRMDHFRGFDTYWKVPASCETAIEGEWVEAPGYELFDRLYKELPKLKLVVEDLGNMRPEALALRDHFHLMGMNVVEFSIFSLKPTKKHQLIYTGTHDNQPVQGWYDSLGKKTKWKINIRLIKYGMPWESITDKMVRFVYGSRARIAIVPLADIIGAGDEARLNTPGTMGSPNWEWRLPDWDPVRRKKDHIAKIVSKTGRAL